MNSNIIINLERPGNTMQIHKDQMKQMLSKTNYLNYSYFFDIMYSPKRHRIKVFISLLTYRHSKLKKYYCSF